jgi:hypothetical protein
MKRAFPILVTASILTVVFMHGVSCRSSGVRQSSKSEIERVHGVVLPESARSFQQGGSGSGLDKGYVAVFECELKDLESWTTTLKIKTRSKPIVQSGDPCVNGWNVWPTNAQTFVPGNDQFSGLKRTWKGDAIPLEMFSCNSPKGDWLHVEIWKTSATDMVVKLYTDWN